jgi:prepilin-type N-terminal cleavage/methylation domain-containing protein
MKRIRRQTSHGAFTLIELLTVISIIAILIAIMSVGMRKAMMIAKNLRQKVEFKAMEVGLELFAKDYENYPDSRTLAGTGDAVCGAQHLAEALVGRDSHGFDPITGWYPPSDQTYRANLDTDALTSLYNAADPASMNRRKQPYVEFKHSGIYTIYELWQGGVGSLNIYAPASAVNRFRSPVITDTFNRYDVTVGGTSVKVGLPVLYFKADSSKRFRLKEDKTLATNPTSTEYKNWIYNFDDNLPLLQLPNLLDPALPDDYTDPADASKTPAQVFYESITQTADAGRKYYKPFNADKFILLSAGWDGIYGTKDDISNFDY